MSIRRETRSLADLFTSIASWKRRAAQARVAGTPAGTENPRSVYLAACAAIGADLESRHGFRYAKSGPHARRSSGDVVLEIAFQSSWHNIAGEHVVLRVHALVRSPKIKQWRKAQGMVRPHDVIAGGELGTLQSEPCLLDWELADRHTRAAAIQDAISAIDKLAIPYFAHFDALPALVQRLSSQLIPGMDLGHVLEFQMCFADRSAARAAAVAFLGRRPDVLPGYREEYLRYAERHDTPKYPSGWAQLLAQASHRFGLGDLSAGDRT